MNNAKNDICYDKNLFRSGQILILQTVGHEMGHNLGMGHDFKDDPKILREQDGVKCKGYMDYDEKTDGWSPCNVADFKEYINNLACGFCLKSLGKIPKSCDM